jgi:hypothetical protein
VAGCRKTDVANLNLNLNLNLLPRPANLPAEWPLIKANMHSTSLGSLCLAGMLALHGCSGSARVHRTSLFVEPRL